MTSASLIRCEPPDAGAVNVRLEPGLAFGTGEHATTRLCLRWLHARRGELAGKRVMDYGTGVCSQLGFRCMHKQACRPHSEPQACVVSRISQVTYASYCYWHAMHSRQVTACAQESRHGAATGYCATLCMKEWCYTWTM